MTVDTFVVDCHNKMPWTQTLTKNRDLFVTVLRGQKRKIRMLGNSVSGEVLLSWACLSSCFTSQSKEMGSCGRSGLFANTQSIQKGLPCPGLSMATCPDTVALGIRTSTHTDIQTQQWGLLGRNPSRN